MTPRELALAVAALRSAKNYDDANPDVGMGPSLDMLLCRVEHSSGQRFTKQERYAIIEAYEEKYGED